MAEQTELILGVAGNFAGHLEQAGEAADFVGVKADASRPKGMFPIFVPGLDHPLSVWPCSSDRLRLPVHDTSVQPEPEIALRCRVTYEGPPEAPGHVETLVPYAFAAADDTSLRQPARKIHEKKNWGPHSKGLSNRWFAIDRFDDEGVFAHFRLASWIVRGGEAHAYGEDSALSDYTTNYQALVDWMVDRLRTQPDEGPLDDLPTLVEQASHPEQAIIFIGATRYTAFGQANYVHPDDEVVVVAYDARRHDVTDVAQAIVHHTPLTAASVLRRRVLPAISQP